MRKVFKYKNSVLIQNILALLSSSIIVKILSLLNRIVMTRMLGSYAISLYIIAIPTIMLFTSIGGFSLNISIAKITSTVKEPSKDIIKKGLKISLITSISSSLILILLSKFISINALKQKDIYFILISSFLFIIVNSINNVYKGFIIGINKLKILSISSIIEQITRFLFVILLLYLFKKNNNIFNVIICIISMTIGEIISLIYNYMICNKSLKCYKSNLIISKNKEKQLFTFSLNTTLTHLTSNIQLFIEPIIFTFCMSLKHISSETILFKYSEINAYVIPTLTLISFMSFQISNALFPSFANNYSKGNINYIENKTNKITYFLLLIGIYTANIYYYYGEKLLNFLYSTNIGSNTIKIMCYFFIFSYIIPLLNIILQVANKDKYILKLQTFLCIIKLLLICIFTLLINTTNYSLIISIIVINILHFILLFLKVQQIIKIKIPVLKLIFIFLFMFLLFYIFTNIFTSMIIVLLFSSLIFCLLVLSLK